MVGEFEGLKEGFRQKAKVDISAFWLRKLNILPRPFFEAINFNNEVSN